jgi:hypothetical protein
MTNKHVVISRVVVIVLALVMGLGCGLKRNWSVCTAEVPNCRPGYTCNFAKSACERTVDGGTRDGAPLASPDTRGVIVPDAETHGDALVAVDISNVAPDTGQPDLVALIAPDATPVIPDAPAAGTLSDVPGVIRPMDTLPSPPDLLPDTVATLSPPDALSLDTASRDSGPADVPAPAPDVAIGCPGACCADTDCQGTCQVCSANHTCVAATNKDDPTGRCAGTCDATGACKSKRGQGCTTTLGGCLEGNTCSPDGYCCDRACAGACEACDVAGFLGTCIALTSGQPHGGHESCAGSNTKCAGSCTGRADGACTFPTGGCGTATCTGMSYQASGTCSAGACALPTPQNCQFACSPASGCTGECTTGQKRCNPAAPSTAQVCSNNTWQDQTVCASGKTCIAGVCTCTLSTCGGSCVDLQSDAANCGTCGHDCIGGTCSEGICQPFVLASPPVGSARETYVSGNRVYVSYQYGYSPGLYSMDANTPSSPVNVSGLPDWDIYLSCIMGDKLYWKGFGSLDGTIQSCTIANCAATTTPVIAGIAKPLLSGPVCDAENKEIVWITYGGTTATVNEVFRASSVGTNIRATSTFIFADDGGSWSLVNEIGRFSNHRADRVFFRRQAPAPATTSTLYYVSTVTNTSSILLATVTGIIDTSFSSLIANDTTAIVNTLYPNGAALQVVRVPLPNGIISGDPPTWLSGSIKNGIADSTYYYGGCDDALPACGPLQQPYRSLQGPDRRRHLRTGFVGLLLD